MRRQRLEGAEGELTVFGYWPHVSTAWRPAWRTESWLWELAAPDVGHTCQDLAPRTRRTCLLRQVNLGKLGGPAGPDRWRSQCAVDSAVSTSSSTTTCLLHQTQDRKLIPNYTRVPVHRKLLPWATMASPPTLQNGQASTPLPADTPAKPDQRQSDHDVPLTSLDEDGSAKRPRDARLISLVLQDLGITAYQQRVPLQLLDFAYRYTSSILSDAQRLSAEGYAGQPDRGGRGNKTEPGASENITVTSIRQAIASRQGYSFQGHLPKEFMLEQAAERNRIALPKVQGRGYGVQLPPEKYCLTGAGWTIKDEWSSDENEDGEPLNGVAAPKKPEDETMGGMDGTGDEDEPGDGEMEDIFGEDSGGGDTSMGQG